MIGMRSRRTFEYLRCGVRRRLGLDTDLLRSAVAIDELHPGETITGNPCIALPGQYERIETCAFGIDIAREVAQLQGAPRKIGPTLRYTLEDVIISGATIYGRGRRKIFNLQVPLSRSEGRGSSRPRWEEYEKAALRSSYVGCHFFGHWLGDDCATDLLAREYGTPMSMPTPAWPDQAGYLAVFGQHSVSPARARIGRLILFDDITQNAHKAARFRSLRALVARGRTASASGRIVYLMRGAGGKQRLLANEPEITDALSRRGVSIVKAETLGVPELISSLLGARMVIGVEGSQLCHAIFTLRDEGGLLVIQPPNRFFNSNMDWARALNMRYGLVVGEGCEAGFHLPVSDLLRTIDLMDAALK